MAGVATPFQPMRINYTASQTNAAASYRSQPESSKAAVGQSFAA